jgi:DNA-binding IclR family transcriptional regulator
MIQVIKRALDILEYCAKHPNQEYSLTEIADHLGLNHATCANILKTLVNRRYIEQMGHKKGYRLGSMAYQLTGNISFRNNLVDLAKPVMKDLCEMLNESVIIAVYNRHDNTRITLHTEFCSHELQVRSNNKGKNAYMTAVGRLIIAYLSKEEQMAIVRNHGLPTPLMWKEVKTIEDFERELAKIREKGVSFHTATSEHVTGIAVPLFYKERVVASLAIYLPVVRFVGELKSLIIDQLTYSGKQLSAQLLESDSY